MSGFRGVNLKATLIEEVEKLVGDDKPYRSIAEFVSEAVRLRLETLTRNLEREA